jgi:hypothetical protein
MLTNGTIAKADLIYRTGGGLQLIGYNNVTGGRRPAGPQRRACRNDPGPGTFPDLR